MGPGLVPLSGFRGAGMTLVEVARDAHLALAVPMRSGWRGQRIVIVRVFVKKTQTTLRRGIKLALERAEEVE